MYWKSSWLSILKLKEIYHPSHPRITVHLFDFFHHYSERKWPANTYTRKRAKKVDKELNFAERRENDYNSSSLKLLSCNSNWSPSTGTIRALPNNVYAARDNRSLNIAWYTHSAAAVQLQCTSDCCECAQRTKNNCRRGHFAKKIHNYCERVDTAKIKKEFFVIIS